MVQREKDTHGFGEPYSGSRMASFTVMRIVEKACTGEESYFEGKQDGSMGRSTCSTQAREPEFDP